MKIIAIVGHSKSGKTRLIRQLIPELKGRGHSVAVIKHCAHGFALDREGKDSWQFMKEGSDGVAMVSLDRLAVLQNKIKAINFLSVAQEYFKGIDIILIEGGQLDKSLKKIEVLKKGIKGKVSSSPNELLAVVSDVEVDVDKPVYRPDQVREIASFLVRNIEFGRSSVTLDIDGASVALNPFVQNIFENVLSGMVKSLKKIKRDARYITLSVIRKDKKDEKI